MPPSFAVYVAFDANHILAIAGVGIAPLIGWHILRNFRTPPGPGRGDRE